LYSHPFCLPILPDHFKNGILFLHTSYIGIMTGRANKDQIEIIKSFGSDIANVLHANFLPLRQQLFTDASGKFSRIIGLRKISD